MAKKNPHLLSHSEIQALPWYGRVFPWVEDILFRKNWNKDGSLISRETLSYQRIFFPKAKESSSVYRFQLHKIRFDFLIIIFSAFLNKKREIYFLPIPHAYFQKCDYEGCRLIFPRTEDLTNTMINAASKSSACKTEYRRERRSKTTLKKQNIQNKTRNVIWKGFSFYWKIFEFEIKKPLKGHLFQDGNKRHRLYISEKAF